MVDWDRLANATARTTERVFGGSVDYARTSEDPQAPFVAVAAVFHPAHVQVSIGEVPVTAAEPILDVREAALGFTPARGDRVRIDGALYTVIDLQSDGTSVHRLKLHRGITGMV